MSSLHVNILRESMGAIMMGRRLDFLKKVQTASKVSSVVLHSINAFGLAHSPLGGSPHLMLSEQQTYTSMKQSSMKDSKYQGLFLQKRLRLFNALDIRWNIVGALVQNIEAMLIDPNASRGISSQTTPSLLRSGRISIFTSVRY